METKSLASSMTTNGAATTTPTPPPLVDISNTTTSTTSAEQHQSNSHSPNFQPPAAAAAAASASASMVFNFNNANAAELSQIQRRIVEITQSIEHERNSPQQNNRRVLNRKIEALKDHISLEEIEKI